MYPFSAECTHCGAVHFNDFTVANNKRAGIEWLGIETTIGQYREESTGVVKNAVIIAQLNYPDAPPCTAKGLVLPFGSGKLFFSG